jgi:hypothetical protein
MRRDWALSMFPGTPVYDSFSEFLEKSHLDAVLIVTPQKPIGNWLYRHSTGGYTYLWKNPWL